MGGVCLGVSYVYFEFLRFERPRELRAEGWDTYRMELNSR